MIISGQKLESMHLRIELPDPEIWWTRVLAALALIHNSDLMMGQPGTIWLHTTLRLGAWNDRKRGKKEKISDYGCFPFPSGTEIEHRQLWNGKLNVWESMQTRNAFGLHFCQSSFSSNIFLQDKKKDK